ncbi:hypothetical protein AAG906_024612 [Vitis piasezkii]
MGMTWLVNSMNEEISSNYMCYSTTKELIYKFLVGLNVEFDEVRGWIIGRVSLPKISEVFAEVRKEESRQHVMLGKKSNNGIVEISTLSVAKGSTNKTTSFQRGFGERPQVWIKATGLVRLL